MPDIAVIPEYGNHPTTPPPPSLLTESPTSFISIGTEGARGLTVASWGDWELTQANVVPLQGGVIGAINVGGAIERGILAVWACLSERPAVNPVVEAVLEWSQWLKGRPVMAVGDFNTGHHWDAWTKARPCDDHPRVVAALASIGLRPLCCAAGVDGDPTHWHSSGRAYHIDHCFVPDEWEAHWSIGPNDPWKEWSDHAPILAVVEPSADNVVPRPPT